MIVRGQSMDLIKLFLNVRKKGGYKKVTENGLWDYVARECEFDASDGLALKLVYAENLEKILKSLKKIVSEEKNIKSVVKVKEEHSILDTCGGFSMDLISNLEPFLFDVSEVKKKKVDRDECDSEKDYCHDPVKVNGNIENYHTKCVPNSVKEECLASVEFKPIKNYVFEKESVLVIDKGSDLTVIKEDVCCSKRKRESAIGILDWIYKVARDPCDFAIGSLPESSEWKDYTTDITWKQVLLIHEAMLVKRNGYSNDQYFTMQKKQRMHPAMYDEPEKLRHSQRIHSAKDLLKKSRSRTVFKSCSPTTEILPDYLSNKHHQIGVNIGQEYQANVEEWTEEKLPYEVDSKWSDTKIWPLGRTKQHDNNLIEREPLGKGRSDTCCCQFLGSTECVRFHVSEKSKRLKLELGIAFYLWRFNRMGEETSVTWTKEEEKKFHNTWKLNPVLSLGGFLDQTIKALPDKSRADLVNYYFNVSLLRRRGEQNRTSPNNITSDDEDEDEDIESETVKPTTLDSTKKTRLKKSR